MSSITGISNVDYGTIASGKRINSAADDASGLAIANKMESQATGLETGAQNAKETENALNIADGALGGINDYLQRIKELSVKASNGLNSASDLSAIQKEIDGALKGIEDLATGTEYNTKKLLDGSMASLDVAANPDGTGMKIQMANSTLETLGIAGYDVTKDFDMNAIDKAIEKVNESRTSIGASVNALGYTQRYNNNASLQQINAKSGLEDLDMAKAISEQRKNEALEQYKIMMQKKEAEQESLITKMFE